MIYTKSNCSSRPTFYVGRPGIFCRRYSCAEQSTFSYIRAYAQADVVRSRRRSTTQSQLVRRRRRRCRRRRRHAHLLVPVHSGRHPHGPRSLRACCGGWQAPLVVCSSPFFCWFSSFTEHDDGRLRRPLNASNVPTKASDSVCCREMSSPRHRLALETIFRLDMRQWSRLIIQEWCEVL